MHGSIDRSLRAPPTTYGKHDHSTLASDALDAVFRRTRGTAGLQFRVRDKDKVRVSVRDRVGVRVSDGV